MLEQVIDAVRNCKKIAEAQFTVSEKDGASNLVTTADVEVQRYLEKSLSEILPRAAFLGEEKPDYLSEGTFWVVDPIDGTSNFVRGMGLSAFSVALIDNGEAVLGVVYNPFTDDLFYAEKGKGAFLNGSPITVSDRDFSHSVIFTAFSLYEKSLAEPCRNILAELYPHCDDFRRLGSAALELCYLAAGRGELYFEIRVFPWDWAAAGVIIREAGGIIGTVHFDDVRYDRPIIIIAANNPQNYDRLRETVRRHIPDMPY